MCINPECASISRLPREIIAFNPSNANDIEMLLHKFGPEGVFEIAQILLKAANDDINGI